MGFMQKVMVFLIVFAAVCAVVTVDAAYGEMMNEEGKLSLTVRRIDEEKVLLSMLGVAGEVNTKEISEQAEELGRTVVAGLERFSDSARQFLGLTQEERPENDNSVRYVLQPADSQ